MESFLDPLRDLPIFASLVLFEIFFVILTFFGYWIFKKTIFKTAPPKNTEDHAISFFGGALLSFLAIFSGLIIVATWQNYSEAKNLTEKEGAAIAALYRTVEGLPENHKEIIQTELKNYLTSVINEDWPNHQEGKFVPTGGIILDNIGNQITLAGEKSEVHIAFISEALNKYNEIVELRRLRINSALIEIPMVLWIVLFVTIGLSYIIYYYYNIKTGSIRNILLLVLGLFTGLIVFTLFSMDKPYRGGVKVEPVIYQTLLEVWEKRDDYYNSSVN